MVGKWGVTLPELTGDEIRNAYIYLPENYMDEPEKRYPVLYMFDGHNVFFDWDATYGKSWGMKEYMDASGTQMIIAAVECDHSPDNGRLKEYTPFDFIEVNGERLEGKGELTMKWMIEKLKPQIDAMYRTIPDREHTFICGSSMGGLMSLYAVLAHNDVFSRAAALSPSIWTNADGVKELAETATIGPDTVIYMDYGARETRFYEGMSDDLAEVSDILMSRKAAVTCRVIPNGEHCEASWERQLPIVIPILMYER